MHRLGIGAALAYYLQCIGVALAQHLRCICNALAWHQRGIGKVTSGIDVKVAWYHNNIGINVALPWPHVARL